MDLGEAVAEERDQRSLHVIAVRIVPWAGRARTGCGKLRSPRSGRRWRSCCRTNPDFRRRRSSTGFRSVTSGGSTPVNAERRGQHWRVTCGPAREAMFRQVHQEGDLAASDFTETSSLRVTIAGQRFEHLAYHFVLTCSNWETVTLCASESFELLSDGLQNAFWERRGTPRRQRSDSRSAAGDGRSGRAVRMVMFCLLSRKKEQAAL